MEIQLSDMKMEFFTFSPCFCCSLLRWESSCLAARHITNTQFVLHVAAVAVAAAAVANNNYGIGKRLAATTSNILAPTQSQKSPGGDYARPCHWATSLSLSSATKNRLLLTFS